MKHRFLLPIFAFVLLFPALAAAHPDQTEYVGQFVKTLEPNREEFEQMVLKQVRADAWQSVDGFDPLAHFSSIDLFHPRTGKESVLTVLMEPKDGGPILFVDANGDGKLTTEEKFILKQEKADNPFLWNAKIPLAATKGFFETYSIFVRYFKSIRKDKMSPGDRLLTQTTTVMARGMVDVNGRSIAVQYELPKGSSKVDAQNGWLGIDADGNGDIDMDNLSPEAAQADAESVVFRVGDLYLSTKRADVSKNQIVLREHEAKDYERAELEIGGNFPDFSFTDFDGKKRKIGDFRGSFVLLDVWGFWCPPCRKELPYIRESHRLFQGRNLAIVGLNTDRDFTVGSMKSALKENGMLWTNAKVDSVSEFISKTLRISSFPTTFLLSPEGKIISMSRHERGELDLRGQDLLESLDEILPK